MVIITGDNRSFSAFYYHLFLMDDTINLLIVSYECAVLKPLPIYVKNSLLGINVRCLCHILLLVCRLY